MTPILAATTILLLAAWWARTADAAVHPPKRIVRAVCHVFGPGCAQALRIARCESNYNPRAVGRAGERGLLQLHPVHFHHTLRSPAGRIYVNPDRLFDPLYNARVAYVLSNGGRNWRPWTCSRWAR